MPIDPRKLIRDARRAIRGSGGTILQNLARSIGGEYGESIAVLAQVFSGSRAKPRPRDVQSAVDLLKQEGIDVSPPKPPRTGPPAPPPPVQRPTRPGQPPPRQPPPRQIPSHGRRQTRIRDVRDLDNDWPEEQVIDTRIISAPIVTNSNVFDNEIETPQSSNVFSFAYDFDQSILYVTFKAPGPAVKKETRVSSSTGKEYTLYHRAHKRGPMYSYGGRMRKIPQHVYSRMKSAASAGEFVWDELRIRGTIYGHRYPYTLVNPGELSDGSVYVPRKATKRGFRVRSAYIPNIVESRELARPNEIVSLPEQIT